MNNTSVDSYLAEGCGRCDRFQTPACKVHTWGPALVELRAMLNSTGLAETMKWGQPTYTLNGKNVVMLAAFDDNYVLSFFKGMLIEDPDGLLQKPGPATHAARVLRFTEVAQVAALREAAAGFVQQAIALERSGAQVPAREHDEAMPDELQEVLDGDPRAQAAFDALTPGRQRSHKLHVGSAKQSSTRTARAERCIPKILDGKGFNER